MEEELLIIFQRHFGFDSSKERERDIQHWVEHQLMGEGEKDCAGGCTGESDVGERVEAYVLVNRQSGG